MAIKKTIEGVSYVGAYVIPDENKRRIALVTHSKDDESVIFYVSEIYTSKRIGTQDSDQYQISKIPLDWIPLPV